MDLQLKGKTALVTGTSTGIGRAIAKGLAAEGVKLCITARRRNLMEELAKEIVAAGGLQPHIIAADLMEDDTPRKLADEALKALGQINILVNNAGGSRPLPFDAGEDKWYEAMTFNFTRVRQLTQCGLPDMIEHTGGRISNLTGKSEAESLNAAHAAKAGVHAWAHGVSKEVGKHNITINSIPPGRILSEQIRRNNPEPVRKEFAEKNIPLGRFGEPEELACLVVFLASPVARYISGTVIPVDAGLRRYPF